MNKTEINDFKQFLKERNVLLNLDPGKEYFLLDIELLTETKDYLLFKIRNKE